MTKDSSAVPDDAMQLDHDSRSAVTPQDADYLDSLQEPLKTIAASAIPPLDTTPLATAASRADALEIALRRHLFSLVPVAASSKDALTELGNFWRASLDLCLHFVFFSEHAASDTTVDHTRYAGMNVRKLPLVLLEDALDTLTVPQCKVLWEYHVETAATVLFCPVMWTPSPKSHPCWLPFCKLSNKLQRRLTGAWAARIMLLTAQVFPLSEKSAIKVWGSYHTDNVTDFETLLEFGQQQEAAATSVAADDPNDEAVVPDYTFYESFWSLQHDFSNPSRISVADFLTRVKSLLQGLDSHVVVAAVTLSLSSSSPTTTTTTTTMPAQYLTSSRLLHVQLADPDFRIHVLTQFLIAAHHLQSEIPILGGKLADSLRRAKGLLRAIPQGAVHLKLVEHVLGLSEQQWRLWKKKKCLPDLDVPLSEPIDTVCADNNDSNKRKRTLDGTNNDADEEQAYQLIAMTTDLPAISQKMRKVVPAFESHFEDYVEALDPDSGIEAEYHPKNDAVFCWRALRLLSTDHLGAYAGVRPTGDMEPAVRKIYKEEKGVDIPGECPEDPPEPEEEEASPVEEPKEEETPEVVEADGVEQVAKGDVKDVEMADSQESNEDGAASSADEQKTSGEEASQGEKPVPVDADSEQAADEGKVAAKGGEAAAKADHKASEASKASTTDQNGHLTAESKESIKPEPATASDKSEKKEATSHETSKAPSTEAAKSQPRQSESRGRNEGPGRGGRRERSKSGRRDGGDRRQNNAHGDGGRDGSGRDGSGQDRPRDGPREGSGRDGPRRTGPDGGRNGNDGSGPGRDGPGRFGNDGHGRSGGGGAAAGSRGDRRDDRRDGDRPGDRRGGDDRREPDRRGGGQPMDDRRDDRRGGRGRRGGGGGGRR